jgi:prepilin-type N-terminal cleavage/methylation domain-containing protein
MRPGQCEGRQEKARPQNINLGPVTRSLRERCPGFTLFEVLITLSILGVILSLLYLTFYQSMKVMADTEDRAGVIQEGRMILELMAGDLRGAILFPEAKSAGALRSGLVGRSMRVGMDFMDRLDFTTLTPGSSGLMEGGGGLREVGYYLERQAGQKTLTLFRRQDDGLDGDLFRGGRSLAVCERVRSLGFSYFDPQGKEEKEWNSSEGERKDRLPFRVEMHLRLEDAQGRIHDFRTQVFLPAAG